eukprot:TRINITY_DN6563_c0_g1_i2.p1 TRINITY_DN6563_c0_g1~~TRINITY_DN6563_c0_g1_i2.p1  ORF type:complete len:347 (+),score=99.60 TRINITY_DN6563_c0_g1_i2:99-1139(+)
MGSCQSAPAGRPPNKPPPPPRAASSRSPAATTSAAPRQPHRVGSLRVTPPSPLKVDSRLSLGGQPFLSPLSELRTVLGEQDWGSDSGIGEEEVVTIIGKALEECAPFSAEDSDSSSNPERTVPVEIQLQPSSPVARVISALSAHCQTFPIEDRPHIMAAFSRDYVARCLSEPHRSVASHTEKLRGCATWRAQRKPWLITGHDAEGELLRWCGRAHTGQRILYARPGLVAKVVPEVLDRAHIWALEELVRSNETSFFVVVDTSGVALRHISAELMARMKTLVTVAYRGRMELCVAGPTNVVTRACWSLLRGLLPGRVATKVKLSESPREQLIRRNIVAPEDIPSFLP